MAYNEPIKEKFDPVAENGKFFEGWKKPKLAIVISGRQDGYLEPCGCAGLFRQKGGHEPPPFVDQATREPGLARGRRRRGRIGPPLWQAGRNSICHLGRRAQADGLRRRRIRPQRLAALGRRDRGRRGRRRSQGQPVRVGQRRSVRPDSQVQDRRSRRHENRRHVGARQGISRANQQRRKSRSSRPPNRCGP